MKALVIGGSGFIGTRLVARHPDWRNVDLKGGEDLLQWQPDDDYDYVVFLAARLDQTIEGYCYNLALYRRMAELFYDKQPFVIYSSSAAVFGNSIYGYSKRDGENIFHHVFKNLSVLRLSNVYGEGDGPGAIDSFINGNRKIYGDGKQVRDYIHVEKVCDAIDNVIKLGRQGTYNVSTGKGKTTLEAFKEFGKGEPDFQPARPYDAAFSVMDPRATKDAGIL